MTAVDYDWAANLTSLYGESAEKTPPDVRKQKDLKHLFGGLTIARVGVSNHAADISKIVSKYGGNYSGFISSKCTHVITSAEDVKYNKYKLDTARKYNCNIVSLAWFFDTIASGIILDEDIYKIEIEEVDKNTIFSAYSNDPITFLANDPSTYTNNDDNIAITTNTTTSTTATQTYRPRYFGLTKIYPWGDKCAPYFPDRFVVLKKVVFHCTDLETNQNKYYAMEIHNATEGTRSFWRVFTHYGRTDELEDPNTSGKRECRYVASKEQAEMVFNMIYDEKSSDRKNYKEVDLVSANIGSGILTGKPDARKSANPRKRTFAETFDIDKINISPKIKTLVNQIYDEATNMLTSIVQAKITPQGIETPLGILTVEQIEKGGEILTELESIIEGGGFLSAEATQRVRKLSNSFYSVIPHRIGKSQEELSRAVIDSLDVLQEKQELVQLMRDIAKIAEQSSGTSLNELEAEFKYKALNCEISELPTDSGDYLSLIKTIKGEDPADEDSTANKMQILNVYKVKRSSEDTNFTNTIFNRKLLFHGSRIENWLGILSRGLLLPKRVTNLGVNRTDYGLLGAGLYFAPQASTSVNYSTMSKKKGNRFMVCSEVALGNVKNFTQQQPDLTAAPINYHSCHGVPATKYFKTSFQEDQYVVYNRNQQRVKYLIEFKLPGDEPIAIVESEESDVDEDDRNDGLVDYALLEELGIIEPPKKKRKIDNTPQTNSKVPTYVPSTNPPPSLESIVNPYSKILATVKSNYEVIANGKNNSNNKRAVSEVERQKASVGSLPDADDDEDEVSGTDDDNEEGQESELPEGAKLITIKQVNPYASGIIAVKGRVIYKSEMFKWGVDKKHTKEGCFFYFEMIDQHRDGLRCVAYNEQAKEWFDVVQEDMVFIIVDPIVKLAYAKGFALVKNDYELNFNYNTKVIPSPADLRTFPKRELNLQDLASIRELPHGTVIDFVAVATEVGPLGFLKSPNTGNDMPKRTIYINDQTNTKSQLMLWYSFAEEPPMQKGQVFLVTGAYVNEYKGFKTINTKHASVRFDLNTKLSQAKELKRWYEQHKAELEAEKAPELNNSTNGGFAKKGKFKSGGRVSSQQEEPMEVDEVGASLPVLERLLLPTWTEREQFAQEFSRLLMREKKIDKWPEIMRGALEGIPDAMLQLIMARLPFKSLMRLKSIKRDKQKIIPLLTNFIIDSAIEFENSAYKRMIEAGKSKFGRELLVNVYDQRDLFQVRNLDDEERYFPLIVPPSSKYLQQFSAFDEGSSSIVPSLGQFVSRFDKITNNFFVDFEWDRTVVSGGAVLASLEPCTPSSELNTMSSEWANSDIDVYFVGMTQEEAEDKIRRIHDHLARHVGAFNIVVVRTKNALTLCSQYPQRNIQIILALFQKPEDIVAMYDLDCVSVLYDGSSVFALPRAVRALNTRMNFVDLNYFSRQTRNHEKRQLKYSLRGFGSLLVNHSNMIPALYTPKTTDGDLLIAKFRSQMHTPKSLAKTLMMQYNQEQSEKSSGEQMAFEMALDNGVGGFVDLADNNNGNDNGANNTNAINYGEGAYLPYGPEWSPAKLTQHLRDNQKQGTNNQFYIFGNLHYCMDTGDDDPSARVSRHIQWEKY